MGHFLWAHRYGTTGSNTAFSVAEDKNGDVLLAGAFVGTVDFGGGPLVSAGKADVFLARFNSDGALLWAERFGGPDDDLAYGVAVDPNGNVLLTGAFQGTVSFGGSRLKSAGDYDVFLAKYSATGAYLWSRRFGGATADSASSVAVDGTGAVAITGYFTGTAEFGCDPLTSHGKTDVFIARYDSEGTHLWSRGAGGAEDDIGNRVAVDASGNVVAVGAFQDSADFGTGVLTSTGLIDVFVARYSAAGQPMWASRFGGPNADTARGVALDPTGAAIVFGEYSGAVDFGGGPLPADPYDVFLAKFSAAGAPVWARGFAANARALSAAVAVNAAGTLAITGKFNDQLDLGDASGPLTGGGVYVAQLGADGSTLWARGFNNLRGKDEDGLGVALDGIGDVVASGDFAGAVDFGGGPLESMGDYDAYVVKLFR